MTSFLWAYSLPRKNIPEKWPRKAVQGWSSSMTYHPPYVFGIGCWKSQGAHVFNISFCIFDEYSHRMILILTKCQKQHHKHTVKSSKIGSVWVPCMLATRMSILMLNPMIIKYWQCLCFENSGVLSMSKYLYLNVICDGLSTRET